MTDDTKEKFFSKEKREIALKWIKEKAPRLDCECCGKGSWTLAEDLVTPTVLSKGGGIVLGGPTYPSIMIICNNCGNTKLFNAIVSGVITPKDAEDGGKKDGK